MVPVVVDQRENPARRRHQIFMRGEAAANAGELRERSDHRRIRNTDLGSDGDRSQRVRHVVHARQVQRDVELCSTFARDAKLHSHSVSACIEGSNLRVLGESVRQQRLAHQRQDLAYVRIVAAHNRAPVKRQTRQEVDKRLLQARKVMPVGFHVVVVDVGDNSDHRIQIQERGIRFVGLDHDVIAASEPRTGAG